VLPDQPSDAGFSELGCEPLLLELLGEQLTHRVDPDLVPVGTKSERAAAASRVDRVGGGADAFALCAVGGLGGF
jgi:hypothetical protein